MRNRVAAAADCHDSLHCITCFDCFDDGDELRQSKDAQHTAPVRLSPVFVAPRRFAIRSLLISFSRFLPAFLPSSSYSFFPLSYLSPFFFFFLRLSPLSFCTMEHRKGLSIWREGGRWVLSRAPVPTGQWQLGCQSRT